MLYRCAAAVVEGMALEGKGNGSGSAFGFNLVLFAFDYCSWSGMVRGHPFPRQQHKADTRQETNACGKEGES